MSKTLQDLAKEATNLPREQRLTLASLLLELDEPVSDEGADELWHHEILARVEAVDDGSARLDSFEAHERC